MGRPITGNWVEKRAGEVTYTGAGKWGTGINPVHAYYGGPALRTYGREGITNVPEIHAPATAGPGFIEGPEWGYQHHDLAGLDVYADEYAAINGVQFLPDDRPVWGESITETRAVVHPDSSRPWGVSGGYKNILRSIMHGPGNINTIGSGFSYEMPTETVSEGWENKAASGMHEGVIPDANPSDDSQLIVQTSMVQRYKNQNNERSQLRATDHERSPIESRVAPMKLKFFSGGQRHYDMFPRQQTMVPRLFWYRTAGTGRPNEMQPNTQWVINPIQRTVPPDPDLGVQQTDIYDEADNYTFEDSGFY